MSDISKGNHLAKCVHIEFGYTNKGTEKLDCTFQIVSDSEATEPDPDEGKEIVHSLWLSEKAAKITANALKLMGWDGEDIGECPDLCAAGKMADVVKLVIHDENYDGKVTRKVKFINPPATMSAAARKQASARFKQALANADKPPEIPASVGADPDDIPF